MCINVFQLIKSTKPDWSKETDVIVVITYLYWCFWTSCLIAVLCSFGNKVNKKVSYCKRLQFLNQALNIKGNTKVAYPFPFALYSVQYFLALIKHNLLIKLFRLYSGHKCSF